jgi:hypothetical protein
MEEKMKKLSIALATLATIAVAAPTIASAEEFGVRIGGGERDFHRDRGEFRERGEFRGARAEFREHGDRGWHRGWDRDRSDRVVIIKKHRHRDWD